MSKILGIDFGLKRMGIAISDPLQRQAFIRPTLHVNHWTEALAPIYALCLEEQVERIVIGLPVPLGSGRTHTVIQDFAQQVGEVTKVRVVLLDERLTSVQADRYLREQAGHKRSKDKGRRDQLAAQIILQNYLDSLPT